MTNPPSTSIFADFAILPAVNLADAVERKRLSPAAVAAMMRLADLWRLTISDARTLAGDVPESVWSEVEKGNWEGSLSQDALTRISALVGIYWGLNLAFSSALANEWVHLPNSSTPYSGRSPLDVMLEGGIPAILEVRRHVEDIRN